MNILIGVGAGLLASLTGWWIVARAITPKLRISPYISKLPDDTDMARWRYRIKVINFRRWPLPRSPAVDLHASATMRVKGLRPGFPDSWFSFHVPLGTTGELSFLRTSSALRLRPHDIDVRHAPPLPEDVKRDIASGDITLERLFELGSRARLRIVVNGAHSYTYARSTAVAYLDRQSIRVGKFTLTGWEVIDAPELLQSSNAPRRQATPTIGRRLTRRNHAWVVGGAIVAGVFLLFRGHRER